MKIKHLKHPEINLQKWDTCIQNAGNSLVYAESWFLDIVSPNWEALVLEDYEYVIPLQIKKKYGISFLVQPPMTQQLGIFSKNKIDEGLIENFIKKISYRSFHLDFNEQNPFPKGIKQHNYVLNLDKDYNAIFSSYSNNTKRNLKKTDNSSIEIRAELTADEFLKFYYTTEKKYATEPDSKVNKLIQESLKKNKITLYGAYNKDNQLISSLCLLHSTQRLIYWLPVSNKEGKETSAMFRIVNEIIRKYANSNFILDFEGSNIKSIAFFYQSFGAELRHYFEVKHWSVNDFIKFLRF
jgi:hypothetical protein